MGMFDGQVAIISGAGPGEFCGPNYEYLESILPSTEPDPLPQRQDCY